MERPSLDTLYGDLGLPAGAPPEDVRHAYRRLAREHHPDHAGPQGDEAMARINHAYEVLSDPQRRAQHQPRSEATRVPGRVVLPGARARARWLAGGGALLVLAAAGWAVGRWVWPDAPSAMPAQVHALPAEPAPSTPGIDAPLKLTPALRLDARAATPAPTPGR